MNILDTDELQTLLKISSKQAKALMRAEGFPAFRIGREYRVTEQALLDWIGTNPTIKLDYSKV